MCLVECTTVKCQRTHQLYQHQRTHFICFVLRSLAAAVVLQVVVESTRFIQAINMYFVAYEWAPLAREMGCTMIRRLLVRIDDLLWIIRVNFNIIVAAILPCCLFSTTRLSRARVIYP